MIKAYRAKRQGKEILFSFIVILALFLILFFIIVCTPIINKYRNNGELIINEVMYSNKNTIVDNYGNFSDYIELYNGYDYDINLEGYYLSDDNFETKKWKFPSVVIKSHDYLLVFASGLNKYGDELHTNFKLDSNGEVVTLSDSNGISLSKLYYLETLEDTSYGYNGQEYVYYYNGTPSKTNQGEFSVKPINVVNTESKIQINEYIVDNVSAYKSLDGNYYSVIELYNDGDFDVNLEGYYLSDKYDNKYKYIFPNVVIKSKDYLVIFASGLDKYDKEIHTNFNLDGNDNTLVLSDNHKNELSKVILNKASSNISFGYYEGGWHFYAKNSIGTVNNSDYLVDGVIKKEIMINEVSVLPNQVIEIKNLTEKTVNLNKYYVGDKSGVKVRLPNVSLKPDSFYLIYGSDNYSYNNGKLYAGFNINSSTEKIYLYDGEVVVDNYDVGKLKNNISSGINDSGKRVFFKDVTLGRINSKDYFYGYSISPLFSQDGGYVEKGTKINLSASDESEIYYTLDGSFPTKNSNKYTSPIVIDKNTVVKAIAYKEGYIESDVVSRTFIVSRKHDVAFVSISTSNNDLYGNNGLLTDLYAENDRKVSFEFYESDGSFGVSFVAGSKLTGMDSRKRPQKSIAIYLRKEYGLQEVTYPFFKDGDTITYSSFTLRNAGEDPFGIRIQDTVMTYALKNQMDIDMQDYRPVVVYLNGEYYGLYNMREKLNSDYVVSKHNVDKGNFDLIKYKTPVEGSINNYNSLINYINSHDPAIPSVYEYLKTQIDMQELCNYLIVESYYGNTDLGNIRYWKAYDGKWRWMLYDLDWSLWNTSISMSYPVVYKKIPAATYLVSTYNISRKLYRNSEFKDLYLSTLAKHLKETFAPSRMNKIVDELANEIRKEMPYHISRWSSMHSTMSAWENSINRFKSKLNNRYNYVVNNLQADFGLSNNEYNKYFGGLK